MRRDRYLIIFMALLGAIFSAQFGATAAIIGATAAAWIIGCALIPAPADDVKESL